MSSKKGSGLAKQSDSDKSRISKGGDEEGGGNEGGEEGGEKGQADAQGAEPPAPAGASALRRAYPNMAGARAIRRA